MKIRRIAAYRVELPLHEGSYKWSGGKSVAVFDTRSCGSRPTAGSSDTARSVPLGPAYLPAYAEGVRAGLAVLAPHLIGEDPRELEKLNRRMDALLKGHPYVKSGIDIACWDILGQAAGLPVATLLGGRYGEDFVLYRAISQESPEAMARRSPATAPRATGASSSRSAAIPTSTSSASARCARCSRRRDVLIADANTGWLPHQAARVVRAVRDVDVYIEQPCATYEECLSVRQRTDHPFVLDETIDGLGVLLRAAGDRAMDVVNLKISKFGGLTRTRQARDLCVSLGHRDDDRGLLGRRRDDGGDRAPGALHADGAALHLHRLQQLRHGLDRGGRAAAEERPHGGVDRPGARRDAAARVASRSPPSTSPSRGQRGSEAVGLQGGPASTTRMRTGSDSTGSCQKPRLGS